MIQKFKWMSDKQQEPLPYIFTRLSNGKWVYRNTKTGRFVSQNEVVATGRTVSDVARTV